MPSNSRNLPVTERVMRLLALLLLFAVGIHQAASITYQGVSAYYSSKNVVGPLTTFPDSPVPILASSYFFSVQDRIIRYSNTSDPDDFSSGTRLIDISSDEDYLQMALSNRFPDISIVRSWKNDRIYFHNVTAGALAGTNAPAYTAYTSLSISNPVAMCVGTNDVIAIATVDNDFILRTYIPSGAAWSARGSKTYTYEFVQGASYTHKPSNRAFFGARSGKLVTFDLYDTSTLMTSFLPVTCGVGDVLALNFMRGGGIDYLYIGTSSGLIVQIRMDTLRIESLVVFSSPYETGPSVNVRIVQAVSATAYPCWNYPENCDNDPAIGRINAYGGVLDTDYSDITSSSVPTSNRPDWIFPAFDNNRLYLQIDNTMYTYDITTCPYTCDTCTTDTAYCGFCGIQTACTNSQGCSNPNTWIQNPTCPALLSISPSRGAVAGGTVVTFTGANYLLGQNNLYKCVFGNESVDVQTLSETAITCLSPSGSAGTVDAKITFNNLTWGGVGNFTFYTCTGPATCDLCLADIGPECGWCIGSDSCQTSGSCSGGFTQVCPAINLVGDNSSVSTGGKTITLHVNAPLPADTYNCYFNSTPSPATPGTPTASGTDVTCVVPATTYDGFVPLTLQKGSVTLGASVPFEYYDCAQKTACFECVLGHQECAFCLDNLQCIYASQNTSCGIQCPLLADINPDGIFVGTTPPVTVTGDFPGVSNPNDLSCQFGATSVVPTSSDSTSVTCDAPGTLPVGFTDLSIYYQSNRLTNSIALKVYNCTDLDCPSCVANAECAWCTRDDGFVGCQHGTASCPVDRLVQTSAATCPAIAILSKNSDSLEGLTTVTLTGGAFPANTTRVNCKWGSSMYTPAITATSTTVSCMTPHFGVVGNSTVAIVVDNTIPLTPALPFSVYDCVFESPQVVRRCSLCSSIFPSCSWCGAGCTATVNCTAGSIVSLCPGIASISTNNGTASGGDPVLLQGTEFGSGSYQCKFENPNTLYSVFVPASIESNTTIRCNTPEFPAGPAKLSLYLDGDPYDNFPLDFTFFQCSIATTCESSCVSSPYCGWCAQTGSCTGFSTCQLALPIESTAAVPWLRNCPALGLYQPTHIQIRTNYSANVAEQVTIPVSAIGSLVTDVAPVTCSFNEIEVNATSITNGVVVCEIPVLDYEIDVQMRVNYLGHPLTNSQLFKFINCYKSGGNCLQCVASKEECGFCLPMVGCSTQARCDYAFQQDSLIWADADCPELTRLEPQSGFTTGGDVLTLTGSLFLNRQASMKAEFRLNNASDPIFSDVTFVDDSTLQVTSPAVSTDGVYAVRLLFDDKPYARQVQAFTYNPPPNIALIAGATVGPVAGALLIALAIIFLVLRRRRMLMFAVQLKEPDYMVVAYVPHPRPTAQWRLPKDNYKLFETALKDINRTPQLFLLISAVTSSTEQDNVAKALVNFYSFHQNCGVVLNLFSQNEINNCIAENTIFRNNSLASRMFKFYSKILGVPYLFHTLARFIVEINTIGDTKTRSKQGGTNSLLSLDMELDQNKLADAGNDNADTEANLYQLILACQKVFSALQKAVALIPNEFIDTFAAIRDGIIGKWPDSSDAVYKAVGGFLFLRFICPAITAPHAYGLLPAPPNSVGQRQLVLIGKVVQNLANLVRPSSKEQFMLRLSDFFDKNIPKMLKFYIDLLARHDTPPTSAESAATNPARNPPAVVGDNALGYLWSHVYTFKNKITAETADGKLYAPLKADMDELFANYKEAKKEKKGGKKDTVSPGDKE